MLKAFSFNAFSARARRVLDEIRRIAEAQQVVAFLVGGPVRDALLGQSCLDLDVSIEGDARQVARTLAKASGGRCEEHPRFGTARVTWGDALQVDLAATRTETYTHPGAWPQVARGDIREDLGRRDFSINAMAVYLNTPQRGRVLDLFQGQDDLRRKRVRILHPDSFRDDPTRMFRALRLAGRLGLVLEAGTRRVWKAALEAQVLQYLTPARWFHEVFLLAQETEPYTHLRRLQQSGVLEQVLPGAVLSKRAVWKYMQHYLDHPEVRAELSPDVILLRLLAAWGDTPRGVLEPVLQAAGLPRAWHAAWHWHWTHGVELRQRLQTHRFTPYALVSALRAASVENILVLAAHCGARAKAWVLPYLLRHRTCVPALKGADLKMLGITPGPEYARILDALLKARLEGRLSTRAEEIRWVRKEVGLVRTGVDAPGKKR